MNNKLAGFSEAQKKQQATIVQAGKDRIIIQHTVTLGDVVIAILLTFILSFMFLRTVIGRWR